MKIALVGIGGYAQIYARALLEEAVAHEVEFAAAVDPQPEQSPMFAALTAAQIPIYPDLEHFFQDSHADLVIISAPIHYHAPFTIQVLAQGVPVLCEKPLAGSWQDGVKLYTAARERHLPVAIGYQWSFDPAIQALKRDIQAGVYGRPLRLKTLVLWSRSLAYFQRNNWAGRQRMPDGSWVLDSPVNNATAHYLHNMLFLLGDQRETSAWPQRLQAELYRANEIENYDAAALRIWTAGGIEILFYSAHPVQGDTGPWMEYEFERATITYRAGENPSFVAHFKDGAETDYHGPASPHAAKIWEVAAALRSGARLACDVETSLPHLLCVHGAQQSSPIQPIPNSHIRIQEMGGDRLVWVDNLAQVFLQSFERWVLPSEIGLVPWTEAGSVVDLQAEKQAVFPDR
jgi:predicted dehydrogenase